MTRRKLLDWVAAGLLVLLPALVLRASVRRGEPGTIDQALLRVTAPLSAGVSWVVEGLGGLWSRYVALIDVEDENRELRGDNERLRRELAAMARRAYDVEALEQLAVLKRRTHADTVGARVIGAPLSPFFRVVRIRIDRGTGQVSPGMPVITAVGLVGRVDKVYGAYADVMLVTDPSSSIEIVLPRTGARGILTGAGRADSYACKLQWLEQAAGDDTSGTAAQLGDAVVTSGLGAEFPAGIPIGTVSKVGDRTGMFQQVEVEPAVDPSRLRAVMVLLAPPPPPDPDAGGTRRSGPATGRRPY
ncbi:MAG: rod shape-determining protein MreC [Kofleriaceae bacterium]|jgi:rod shape-determining protein MreC|nr:rod shape-determining protein MreC [Kofleriaceae bacterium]MBP6839046.1 rod shape-determining protein MreC [Kofleriaceae bacterium]MBP9207263.1 rod shape-determining protein MreC [Kofleriaceae bacterium]